MMMTFIIRVQQLFAREFIRIRSSVKDTLINYWIIWPFLFSYPNGYFIPLAAFGEHSHMKATELVLGVFLIIVLIAGFFNVLEVINERLETKVFQHHVTATSFEAVFFSRQLFYMLYTFLLIVPYCPLAKLLLGSWFITDHASWGHMVLIALCAAMLTVSYLFCWVGILKKMSDMEHMWERGIEPLMWLGGAWAPAHAIITSGVPGMTFITRINPFTYVTDALRQAFLPGDQFMPLSTCYAMMLGCTLFFMVVSYNLLKKRMDLV